MTAQLGEFQTALPRTSNRKITWKASNTRFAAPFSALFLTCVMGSLVGCRGRAHQDLYQAKMANEIRVLEDQLYDADYQNRVLRDQLERTQQTAPCDQPTPPHRAHIGNQPHLGPAHLGPAHSGPIPSPSFLPHDARVMRGGSGTPGGKDVLNLDEPSLGAPILGDVTAEPKPAPGLPSPPALTDPPKSSDPADKADAKPDASDQRKPLVDPPDKGLGMPAEAIPKPVPDPDTSPGADLPAPAELIPPGKSQLIEDSVIPGEVIPPSSEQNSQPDKITIPPGTKTMRFDASPDAPLPVPDHLELHDGLSGGHQFDSDDDIDGLYLVVTVADKAGNTLSLDDYDVDAELTIVVLDANDESEDAHLGRWEFSPDEVRDLVRRAPVDGIHIPISWQDRIPSEDDVIVHVRMAAAEEEMRCQGRIRLDERVAISSWLPRG